MRFALLVGAAIIAVIGIVVVVAAYSPSVGGLNTLIVGCAVFVFSPHLLIWRSVLFAEEPPTRRKVIGVACGLVCGSPLVTAILAMIILYAVGR